MSMVLPSQAYTLQLKPQSFPVSVLRFSGKASVSELYEYQIDFTSPVADIPMDQGVGRPATFTIDPVDPDQGYLQRMFGERWKDFSKMPKSYVTHGMICRFEQLGMSADETRYRVVLVPRIADLARARKSRLFQMQSVVEIITDTLRHYGYRLGVDFDFMKLRGKYKRREYVTQYHETTFAFIQRLCAEEGLWFRFEQKSNGTAMIFGDDLDAYARKQRVVPYRLHSGLESAGAESLRSLKTITRRVPEAIQLDDYNHRQADVSLLVESNAAPADKTTDGVDNHWGEHYETQEEGKTIALIRHEAHLAEQISYSGRGNPFSLEAGEVMRLDVNPKDAPHGLFVTSVRCGGGRGTSYWCAFRAIPADRRWRTSIDKIERPKIAGTLPARIDSPGKYKYSYLTEKGLYVTKMPFDLDEWSPGGRSRPIRMARPYAGPNYGHHMPLIDGTEVALVFTAQDPNRPIIVGALHDSLNPDLVNNLNHTRNIIRSAAENELRMEDKAGVEHIHLTTPYQTSELNLGHMVDEGRKERGRGAELRSDEHIAVRGGKGLLLTAEVQRKATGAQLDMAAAQEQLKRAIERIELLNQAVQSAEAVVADLQKQKALFSDALDGLKQSVVLMSGPSGIGITSGEHLQLNADQNLIATAGGNADIGVMRNFTVAAGRQVSLFAQSQGMRLTAAKQDIVVHARTGGMELSASKDMHFNSIDGAVTAQSKGALTLTSGGAYIKIEGGNIELGAPGSILLKCGSFNWSGPGNLSLPMPEMPIGPCKQCLMDAHRGVEAMTEVA
ncbi:type VI secretion system Vgr family protein [Caballeronia sp. HLA56]